MKNLVLFLGIMLISVVSTKAFHGMSHASHSSHVSHSSSHISHMSSHVVRSNSGHSYSHSSSTSHPSSGYHYSAKGSSYHSYTRPTVHQRFFNNYMMYYFIMRNSSTNKYDTIKSLDRHELDTKIAGMEFSNTFDNNAKDAGIALIIVFGVLIIGAIALAIAIAADF